MAETRALTVVLAADLRRRIGDIAKRLHTTTTAIIREATTARVKELEEEYRRELLAQAAEREELDKRFRRPGRPSVYRPLEPISESAPRPRTTLDGLYDDLARTIIAAGDDSDEGQRRVDAAVEAIKHECPLTYPSDVQILATIKKHVDELRSKPVPETRSYDDLVGKIINLPPTNAQKP